tara:strand:+ start:121 stop:654 length:534 start_codon:yes stop_codon:yes gene_type:complete
MNEGDKSSAKNLYLIGFMAVGKSHLGRLVADSLGFKFLDTDQMIEEQLGRTILEIFESEGESKFRSMEKTLITSGLPDTASVISCGGGLPIPEGMMHLLKSKGVVLALFASVNSILERTARNSNRPLLQVDNPEEEIRNLLDERTPVYLDADVSILTDERSTSEIVSSIIRAYHKHA